MDSLLNTPIPDDTRDPNLPPRSLTIPNKFRDDEGEIRVEALLKSYLELERKLDGMVPKPGDGGDFDPRLRSALGVPETPDGYAVTLASELLERDGEADMKMHEAGFTPKQVQLAYDLAAERMIPALEAMAAEFESDRELERLIDHFGGEEQWREISRSLTEWGKRNLPESVYEALSSTADGVLTLHRMMENKAPVSLPSGQQNNTVSESDLRRKVGDPRYWRDKDPRAIEEVSRHLQRLYPDRK